MTKKYMDFVPAKNADKKAAVTSGAPRRTNVAEKPAVASVKVTKVSGPKVLMPEPTATPRTRMVRRSVTSQRAVQNVVTRRGVQSTAQSVTSVRGATRSTMMQSTVRRVAPVQSGAASGQAVGSVGAQGGFAISGGAKLGEIEDLSPKFVKMDVPKRPLGESAEHKIAVQPAMKDEVKEAKSKKLIGRFKNKGLAKGAAKNAMISEKKAVVRNETFAAPKPTFINQDKVAKRPLSKNVYQKKIATIEEKASKGPVAIITKPEKESKVGLVVAIILTIILGAVAGTIAFLLLPK